MRARWTGLALVGLCFLIFLRPEGDDPHVLPPLAAVTPSEVVPPVITVPSPEKVNPARAAGLRLPLPPVIKRLPSVLPPDRIGPEAAPKSRTEPRFEAPLQVTQAMQDRGQGLLLKAETGTGIRFSFRWPESGQGRKAVLSHFLFCLDAKPVVVKDGHLLRKQAVGWVPWQPDHAVYARIVRDLSAVGFDETPVFAVHGAQALVLPRTEEARALGGLLAMVPETTQTVEAGYRMVAGELVLSDIVADGRAVPGKLALGRGRC